MTIITEEMRYRQRLCEYALKHGVTKAASRYHTYRQFVYRQLDRYDGTVCFLALRSRRPHSHPNAHTKAEIDLIMTMYKRHGEYGLAEVYVKAKEKGYDRCFQSMCRQIRKRKKKTKKRRTKKSYTKYKNIVGKFPGDKVQIDIKYVPTETIRFNTYGKRYYQITAIDKATRKRVLKIVEEKSTYETVKFLKELESKIGFKIHTIQTDNGTEFANDDDRTDKKNSFQKAIKQLNMSLRRTRPYSPWQNGRVERSHRVDQEILYDSHTFYSKKQLIKAVARHEYKYNNTAKYVLNFKTPEEMVKKLKTKYGIA